MADDTVSKEFAEGITAALAAEGITAESPKDNGAPAQAAGTEPTGVPSEVQALAAELAKLGATPEQARAALHDLTSLQTQQGQQEFARRFLESEAGRPYREQFSNEYLAAMLSDPRGASRLVQMARQFGADTGQETAEELTPEQQELRQLKQEQAALKAKMAQIEGASVQTQRAFAEKSAIEQQQAAFLDWARQNQGLPEKAYVAVARRAAELARLEPNRYASADGFRRATKDAHAELSAAAVVFAPPKRPTSLRSGGGGVVPGGFDPNKHSLSELIGMAAEDYAGAVRGEE